MVMGVYDCCYWFFGDVLEGGYDCQISFVIFCYVNYYYFIFFFNYYRVGQCVFYSYVKFVRYLQNM